MRAGGQGQVLILLGPATWWDSQSHNQVWITELVKYFYALWDILIKICIVPVLYILYFYDLFQMLMAFWTHFGSMECILHTHTQITQMWVCVCVCVQIMYICMCVRMYVCINLQQQHCKSLQYLKNFLKCCSLKKLLWWISLNVKKKAKQSRYRPGVAQRVPGS